MKKLCIINSGCEGHEDIFRRILKGSENKYEITLFPDEADFIIHYACGFTEGQLNELFQYVVYYEKLKKDDAKLIICGCGVSIYKQETFDEIDVIDHAIVGMNFIPEIAEILGITITEEQYYEVEEGVFKITIANGCKKPGGPCNFCKQNYLKIPTKSTYSIERICELIKFYKKPAVYLQAMNSTNYGVDFGDHKPKLHTVIHEVSKIDTVKWIFIDGVASSCVYEELVAEIENNEKVVNVMFFVQSGSDHMLKTMNIGSTVADNTKILKRLKGKTISGGVVVGHPKETIEDVYDTIKFIEKNNLWYIDVLSYKDSFMTPSGKMDKLSAEEYKTHCSMVKKAVRNLSYQNMSKIAEKGIIGFVESLKQNEDHLEACVKPIQFEGICYVDAENISVKSGDKVLVHNPSILDIDHHSFEGGSLEVIE